MPFHLLNYEPVVEVPDCIAMELWRSKGIWDLVLLYCHGLNARLYDTVLYLDGFILLKSS